MNSHFFGESEGIVTKPLLTVKRNVQLSLFLSFIWCKFPSWGLAMDRIDKIRITILSEWISNELCFFSVNLSSCLETALWITNSKKST